MSQLKIGDFEIIGDFGSFSKGEEYTIGLILGEHGSVIVVLDGMESLSKVLQQMADKQSAKIKVTPASVEVI